MVRRRRLSERAITLAMAVLIVLAFPRPAPAENAGTDSTDAQFRQVGEIALPDEIATVGVAKINSGWMIIDSENRRGFTFTEANFQSVSGGSDATIIESFDLDTLQKLRRVEVPGLPVPSGFGSEGRGNTTFSGDFVHAIDSESRRIYLAWNRTAVFTPSPPSPDDQRPTNYVLVLDEAQFETDPGKAFGTFTFVGPDQRFSTYGILGMEISPHRTGGGLAKLQAVFASLYPVSNVNVGKASTFGGATYDHTLVQWDPTSVTTGHAPPPRLFDPQALPATPLPSEWQQVLTSCATAPMSSAGTEDAPNTYAKNFEWEFLPTEEAVFVGCQSAPGSGGVVRLSLDSASGRPAAGANERIVALGKPLGDVLVDRAGRRLYLRSFGSGATWWAFDAASMRFAGSIASHLTDSKAMAAGLDPATGRLYTLTPDTCAPRQGGGEIPFRGGVKIADARLDPVPAQQVVRPDLAYNSWWRIRVDSKTRRVFIRRGVGLETSHLQYPECDLTKRVPGPQEFFYRVFEDRIPVAEQPAELDDAPFTTNVKEQEGLTQASYLGTGGGFGVRTLLTGGLAAATNGASDLADNRRSPCSRDDRELLAGSVSKVEVSDLSTAAEAASLDADARTQEVFGNPETRCRPQPSPDDPKPPTDTRKCVTVNTPGQPIRATNDELAFDKAYDPMRDDNHDDCPDRTNENLYSTDCIGEEEPPAAKGPENQANKRDGFKASVKCEEPDQRASGKAEGALGSAIVDAYHAAVVEDARENGLPAIPAEPLRVGRSSSNVTVNRELGKGITVKVDSIARGIEIPGLGSIGLVRTEVTSKANGRDGGARGTFERTICDIAIGTVRVPGCLGDEGALKAVIGQLNEAMGGRGEVRMRMPDGALIGGTEHGYLASVQRDRKQLFSDQTITRDRSLAIPGLEIIFYRGDGGQWGAGRQVIQLAGAQAATSYGIVCIYGQASNGKCAGPDDGFGLGEEVTYQDGETIVVSEVQQVEGASNDGGSADHDPAIVRLIKKIPQAVADMIRLLFNNPRELGLIATVWALLYAPCYLGERRRSIRGLAARRAVGGV